MLRWQGSTLCLTLFVQPKAARNQFCGVHGDALKLQITAPPVDNAANDALVKWLAQVFSVPKQRVRLQAGQHSRHKQVQIECPERIPDWLQPFT